MEDLLLIGGTIGFIISMIIYHIYKDQLYSYNSFLDLCMSSKIMNKYLIHLPNNGFFSFQENKWIHIGPSFVKELNKRESKVLNEYVRRYYERT